MDVLKEFLNREYGLAQDTKVGQLAKHYGELFYVVAFGLYSFAMWMRFSNADDIFWGQWQTIYRLITRVVLAVVVLRLATQRYTLWQLFSLCFAGFCIYKSYRISADSLLLCSFLVFAASKNIRIELFAASSFISTLIVLLVTVISCLYFGVPNVELTRGTVIRYAYGFGHPNALGLVTVSCLFAWILMRGRRISGIEMVSILTIIAVVYHITDSRTSLMLGIMALILGFADKLVGDLYDSKPTLVSSANIAALAAFLLLAGSTIWLMQTFSWENTVHVRLNVLLSNRPQLSNSYFKILGLHPWGVNIYDSQVVERIVGAGGYVSQYGTFIVDNSYAHVLMHYGVVPSFLFACSAIGGFVYAAKHHLQAQMALAAIVVMVVAFSENVLPVAAYTYPLWLVMFNLLFGFVPEENTVC